MHHYKSCCTINKDMRERQSQYVVQEERTACLGMNPISFTYLCNLGKATESLCTLVSSSLK